MKKIVKIISLIILVHLMLSCEDHASNKINAEYARAEKTLKEHLWNRYGEEFDIFLMRKREANNEVWYVAEIRPQKYIGTPKEYDSYYWATGNVNVRSGYLEAGDTYGGVLINEGANAFFGKKVEELFGPNYLCVINVEGPYTYRNFAQESERRRGLHERTSTGKFWPISGSIYIFGRVENDEDREWYRKQIFKLVSFFKETGNFEYVSLSINIIDERCLACNFTEGIGTKLIEAKKELKTAEEFIKYREMVLSSLDEEYKKMSSKEKNNKINLLNRSKMFSTDRNTEYELSILHHLGILSPKFLKNERRMAKYKITTYDTIDDFNLLNTIKIIYGEYDRERIYNNEGVD